MREHFLVCSLCLIRLTDCLLIPHRTARRTRTRCTTKYGREGPPPSLRILQTYLNWCSKVSLRDIYTSSIRGKKLSTLNTFTRSGSISHGKISSDLFAFNCLLHNDDSCHRAAASRHAANNLDDGAVQPQPNLNSRTYPASRPCCSSPTAPTFQIGAGIAQAQVAQIHHTGLRARGYDYLRRCPEPRSRKVRLSSRFRLLRLTVAET